MTMRIRPAQERALAKIRRGQPLTADDKVNTITSREELDAYEAGLKRRGALTNDDMAAILRRRAELSK